ncbi:MAG: flap endonuclease [Gemmatimonadetes bacterium]|nr:flap endonuclease [Gemmatimonadota bacterium]
MQVHLVDGTYELYRHYFAVPKATDAAGQEVGALIGVLQSMLALIESGATHLGVATDHIIESFRNDLWPGYKTGDGIEPDLHRQFHPLERALGAMGVVVWPMVEFEADDALASAARQAAADPRVTRVLICTPDKDLAQSVVGDRVVQFDRRHRTIRDEAAVIEKFGVPPASIPDWLALVGDSADGYPGIGGWGPKSAAALLARYRRIDAIPLDAGQWDVQVRGASRLADSLRSSLDEARLFQQLATLRTDAPTFDLVEELRWLGPSSGFAALAADLGAPDLGARAERLAPPSPSF